TLDHKTLEEIRLMAVQRVWEGERPSVVIASYGFARPVIYRWLREARGKGRGLRALRSRERTGRAPPLAPQARATSFSLDQRQRSSPTWVRFWFVDTTGGAQADRGYVWGQVWRQGGGHTSGTFAVDAQTRGSARD